MDKEKTALYKSKMFAIDIIKYYKIISEQKHEDIMSKQLFRCGTSIGANLAESEYAISENDFLSKVYIALKEAAETLYWLDLLQVAGHLNDDEYEELRGKCDELRRMLSATTKTITSRQNDNK